MLAKGTGRTTSWTTRRSAELEVLPKRACRAGHGDQGHGRFLGFIERVEYSVTNLDDGDAFNASTCNLGAAVTPTQNTFSATDVGAFECPYNCSQVGSSLSIVYQ